MKNVSAIVAVNNDWGIGKCNKLLYHIKDDMKRFKNLTENNVVIMGRKTYDSLPKHKPLPNRINVVITRSKYKVFTKREYPELNAKVYFFPMYEVKKLLKQDVKVKECIYIIGGESIYKQLLPFCNRVYLTKVYNNKDADTFFPNIDNDKNWKLLDDHYSKHKENDIEYEFMNYVRVK